MMDGIQILSGLGDGRKTRFAPGTAPLVETGTACYVILQGPEGPLYDFEGPLEDRVAAERRRRDIADGDRKSVGSGKSVVVSVDLGGRRIRKKKNDTHQSE